MDELERQEQLIRQTMQELNDTMTVSADSFFKLNKETSKLGKTIENAEEAIDRFWRGPVGKTTKAVGDMAKGAASAGMAARKNRESFESLNPAIEGAASALSALPIVGNALGKTLSTVGTFVTAELQRSVEAFQTLGSVGGVGAAGLTGLKDSARDAGLAFDQLAKITASNAKGLAFATGSTAEGARAVAQITKAAKPFQEQLLALGVGISQQSEYFADYLQLNRRLNRNQSNDYRSLAAGSAAYVKQLNLLSRLTGESADAMKAELESQMSNVQFNAAIKQLAPDLQEGAQNIAAIAGQAGPTFRQGIQDLFGGSIGTKAAQEVFQATGGQAKDIIDQFKSRLITQEEALARLRDAAEGQVNRLGLPFLAAAGNLTHAFTNTGIEMINLADNAALTRENLNKVGAEAVKAAGAQDPATKGMVNAQQSLQRFAVQMDEFVDNQVFPHAANIMGEFADSLADLAGEVNSLASGNYRGAGLGASLTGAAGGAGLGFLLGGPVGAAIGGVLGTLAPSLTFSGTRAAGGPVSSGGSYLVGEEGPEMFSPNQGGFITDTNATQEYIASRQEYAKKMIAELFSDPARLSEGYETASGETVSLVNDGKGGVSIAGAQGTTYYDTQGNFIKHVLPTLAEGLTNTLYAGGGQSTSYTAGGAKITQNFDPTGKVTSQQGSYSANGMRVMTDTDYTGMAGPKTSYSGVASVDGVTRAMGHGTLGPSEHRAGGGLETEKLTQLFEQMATYMQNIDANTRTGADTSKKLLRASTG